MTMEDRVRGYPSDEHLRHLIDQVVTRHDDAAGPTLVTYYDFNRDTMTLTREYDGHEVQIDDRPLPGGTPA